MPMKIIDHGFQKTTWNFLKVVHGKGPADGIGSTIKRNADHQVVSKKLDITCAKDFVDLLSNTYSKIKLF